MGTIERRFFWIMICISMLLVHITFIVFDVNVYQYLFWPYIMGMISIIVFAAVVCGRMENLMKKIGPDPVIKQVKKIMSSISFWGLFVIITALFAMDFYLLGQLFIPQDPASGITNSIIIFLLLVHLITTVVASYIMRIVISSKTKN